MCYKCIKAKTCGKTQVHLLNQLGYYCITNYKCIQRNKNVIALQNEFKGTKYYCIMYYIQVNQMDQNILHSHLVFFIIAV